MFLGALAFICRSNAPLPVRPAMSQTTGDSPYPTGIPQPCQNASVESVLQYFVLLGSGDVEGHHRALFIIITVLFVYFYLGSPTRYTGPTYELGRLSSCLE